MDHNLYDEIYGLIQLGAEGEYWDFKKEWHTNKADLLHDIICMANNLANRDGYIIIGVSDSQSQSGIQITDVSSDANRKNQQQLITFLRDKKFVGGVRPTVYLEIIDFENGKVDVVIVKSTNKTPYYLSEDFKEDGYLRSHHIYTRIGDTNTPKDKTADLDKIEYLWRKRFGIDLTVSQRLLILLDHPKEWVGDFKNDDMVVYHSIYPEFQIRISDKDENDNNFGDNNSIIQNLVAHNPNESHSVSKIDITNHSTVLFSEYVVFLDGYRYVIPVPSSDTVYISGHHELEKSLTYLYFDTSTVRGKLYQCLLTNWYLSDSYEYSKDSYIVFKDELERNNFNVFVYKELPELLPEYLNLLNRKGYDENSQKDLEYFYFGWSKSNEIKAKYLADKFFGENKNLCDYISEK